MRVNGSLGGLLRNCLRRDGGERMEGRDSVSSSFCFVVQCLFV